MLLKGAAFCLGSLGFQKGPILINFVMIKPGSAFGIFLYDFSGSPFLGVFRQVSFAVGFLEMEFRLDLCRLRSVSFEMELQDCMYLGTLFRKRWAQIAFCSDKAGSSSSKQIISSTFFNR